MSEGRHVSPPKPVGATHANGANTGSDSGIDVAIDDGGEAEKKPAMKGPDSGPPPSSRSLDGGAKRVRAKITLKIPDDEVSRPQPTPSAPPPKPVAAAAAPAPAPPEVEPPLVPMTPMRIITIESAPAPKSSVPPPSQTRSAPLASAPPPPPPPPPRAASSPDDSWTPYEPVVSAVSEWAPAAAPPPVAPRPPRSAPDGASNAQAAGSASPSVAIAPPAPTPPAPPAQAVSPLAPAVAAAVPLPVEPPPPTGPIPPAPPTEPRGGSMDDILVVADEPPSSGEIELDEDARPTGPGEIAESPPKPVVAAAPFNPPSPPRIELTPAPPPPVVAAGAPAAAVATAPASAQPAGPIAPSPPRVASVPEPAGSQPKLTTKDLPPMRALAPTEPEGLEVNFEDEEEEPEGAPVPSPRRSEPEAEIAAEDLVSVESAPSPAKQLAAKPQSDPQTPGRAFAPVGAIAAAAATAPRTTSAARSLPPPPSSSAKPATAAKVARVIVPTASPLAPPPMSESAPGRRKARPWWEELFNDDFIRTMAKVTDEQIAKEVDFVEESLAVAKGAMLLDLACGTGRHAIELTRRGYKVVGFDLSLPMLAKAAEEAQERNQKLNFVQGDMREMTFEDTFDGIYCWNTSFGFFEEEKNAQVIQRVHKALKKGGQFMLEVGNRDYIIRQAPSLAWFEGDGCICMDEMSIDWITSRMKVKRTMMMDDGRTKEIDYSVRIYSLHELGRILHESGFRVAEVSGRTATPGVYFGSESPKTMILAEKK